MAVRTPLRMTTSLASLMMCLQGKDHHYPAIRDPSHRRGLALDQTPVATTGFRDATRAGREGDEATRRTGARVIACRHPRAARLRGPWKGFLPEVAGAVERRVDIGEREHCGQPPVGAILEPTFTHVLRRIAKGSEEDVPHGEVGIVVVMDAEPMVDA